MNKKKIAMKIALIAVLCTALVMVFASCGGNTAIDTSKGLDYWSGNAAGNEETTGETPEDGSEVGTEAGTEGGAAGDVENGGGEKKKVEVGATKSFIDHILSWIGIFLGWITKVMPANSYIITLCIFAIILEILFLPFGIKQHKNSIRQAKLRPKEMAIRKKYAGRNDQATKQKVTQEIQELYQKEGYNPMSGCMPMLIQLPLILVLYWVVIDPIKYVFGYSAEFNSFAYAVLNNAGVTLKSTNGSIELLNKIVENAELFTADKLAGLCANPGDVADCVANMTQNRLNFNIGALNFGDTPSFDFTSIKAWLLLVPVLTFVVYFFSMKINRKLSFQPTQAADDRQQACSNNMMDFTMPLMSVYITFVVPAAIGIYWMFKSVIGVVKQFVLAKAMPLPVFTEEDYKAAEKELLGKQPKKIQKSANAGKVRSLHHIDDEDYDEQGNYRPVVAEPEVEEKKEPEALPENKMTEGASLKDESDKGEKKEKRSLFGKKDKKD